ncbi:MAG: High-affinity zinc uptake system ATP-binding protein ZnuC [Chlamydiae bacterium]|nr:High-affinity zinc uptake system ATP-binding protein ZnuC [Chlamydiota bacterium]
MKENAFSVHQLCVNYEKTPVLWDISFSIPEGKLVALIGPNGAGKSTLFKAALGFLKPLSGKISFFGEPLAKMRKKIAYVPQRESVDWNFPITVFDLVLMGSFAKKGLFRRPGEAEKAKAQEKLALVGLESYGDRQISQLSGGQQQRAFLARALMQEAELYFMDEPFTGIDIPSTEKIVEILKSLRDQGKSLFLVHHDLNSVQAVFDWVVLLNLRLVDCGEVGKIFTPEKVRQTYGCETLLFDEALKLSYEKMTGVAR